MQILNVALGGTLYGDLEEFPGGEADHPGARWDSGARGGHARRSAPTGASRIRWTYGPVLLASHLGEHAEVDSYHHQAVKDVGTGLEAVAWAPHGTIEAVEMPGIARSSSASSGSSTRSGRTTNRRWGSGRRSSTTRAGGWRRQEEVRVP